MGKIYRKTFSDKTHATKAAAAGAAGAAVDDDVSKWWRVSRHSMYIQGLSTIQHVESIEEHQRIRMNYERET